MGDEKIKVVAAPGVAELIIREGSAEPIILPKPISFTGTFDAVVNWWKIRKSDHDKTKCMVVYSKEKNTISLIVGEREHYQDVINGKFLINKEVEDFKINSDTHKYSVGELSKFLNVRRFMFADPDAHKTLIDKLNNFKARVAVDMEASKSHRGDSRDVIGVKVNHEIPESFKLCIEVIKGRPPVTFFVDIYIDSSDGDFKIYLQSVELIDLVNAEKNKLFAETLAQFEGLPLMEQ